MTCVNPVFLMCFKPIHLPVVWDSRGQIFCVMMLGWSRFWFSGLFFGVKAVMGTVASDRPTLVFLCAKVAEGDSID